MLKTQNKLRKTTFYAKYLTNFVGLFFMIIRNSHVLVEKKLQYLSYCHQSQSNKYISTTCSVSAYLRRVQVPHAKTVLEHQHLQHLCMLSDTN